MHGNDAANLFLADHPARTAVELIADKWSVAVLAGLSRGPVRRGALLERIRGISGKVLNQTLRRREEHGLVGRHAYAEAPPRVEYALTPLGLSLMEPINALTGWVREHGDEVVAALEHRLAS